VTAKETRKTVNNGGGERESSLTLGDGTIPCRQGNQLSFGKGSTFCFVFKMPIVIERGELFQLRITTEHLI